METINLLELLRLLESVHEFYNFIDNLEVDDILCLSMVSKEFRRIFGRCSFEFWSKRYSRESGQFMLMAPHQYIQQEKLHFASNILKRLQFKKMFGLYSHTKSPYYHTILNYDGEPIISISITGIAHPLIGIEFPSFIRQYCQLRDIDHVVFYKTPSIDNSFLVIVDAMLRGHRRWFRYIIDSKSKHVVLGHGAIQHDYNLIMTVFTRAKKYLVSETKY